MQYAIWNDEMNTPTSVMRQLPDALVGKSIDEINALGYREMVTEQPEELIPRFAALAGPTHFELREDGRVYQTFPEADFSLVNVRKHLKEMAARDAGRVLIETDWYVVREYETGTPVPEDIKALRQKIRDHVSWIQNDIDQQDARSLVEYRWAWPKKSTQVMVDGVPVNFDIDIDTNAPPRDMMPPPPPIYVPSEFNASVVPLIKNISGRPVDSVSESPIDANDLPPIVRPHFVELFSPNEDEGAAVDRGVGTAQPVEKVEDLGDIRLMDEVARSLLDPEVRVRMEEEAKARQEGRL